MRRRAGIRDRYLRLTSCLPTPLLWRRRGRAVTIVARVSPRTGEVPQRATPMQPHLAPSVPHTEPPLGVDARWMRAPWVDAQGARVVTTGRRETAGVWPYSAPIGIAPAIGRLSGSGTPFSLTVTASVRISHSPSPFTLWQVKQLPP